MMMKYLIFVVIIFVCMLTTVKANCVIAESVTNADERQSQQKLLQKLDPILGQRAKELKDQNNNVYDFVVCEDVDKEHKNVSIIENSSIILGYNNETVMSAGDNWLMMTFLRGDAYKESCNKTNREAHILFVCDPDQKQIELHTVGELKDDSCYLLFIVSHNVICTAAIEEGLSGGTIFFILLLVSFGAYFIFGFFYLRLVKGAKGIEQIPNREFWFRIGNLLADGCGAVFRCDQYCGSGSNASSYQGYSPIEDRMARDLQDTDRDSALLQP